MLFANIDLFKRANPAPLRGPLALIICENAFLIRETVDWYTRMGARHVIALGAVGGHFTDDETVTAIAAEVNVVTERTAAINEVIHAVGPAQWVLLCFNGEFAFFPHLETRCLSDFTDFMSAERRTAVTGYTIDLYSDALGRDEAAFSLDEAYFDTEGWYGFEREGRQIDVYGGLGWRYEEYTPRDMFRINRPTLFIGGPDVDIKDDLWLTEDEANAVSCPWHHNPTMAVMSVRRARALRNHPKFGQGVETFIWPNSERFEWQSEQLVGHGLIEKGQWL
ncbi:MAG: hypothetical protein ACPGFA_00670 [Pikeienuella sp.]